MKVKRAFIQSENGIPACDVFFRAWEGFRKRDVPCELFEPPQLRRGELSLTRETLVAGGVPVVEDALTALGVSIPVADNLPERLAKYRGRRVWTSTWGELRQQYGRSGPRESLWVKSLRRNKGTPSIAVFSAEDLSAGDNLPDDHEVLVSEYVVFAAEWRCFVCRGKILDLCRYQGEVFCHPDPKVVKNTLADFGSFAPAAYGIDFGILTTGQTVLVEVNDGYSLGPYGLEATDYAELLETRWLQLMQT